VPALTCERSPSSSYLCDVMHITVMYIYIWMQSLAHPSSSITFAGIHASSYSYGVKCSWAGHTSVVFQQVMSPERLTQIQIITPTYLIGDILNQHVFTDTASIYQYTLKQTMVRSTLIDLKPADSVFSSCIYTKSFTSFSAKTKDILTG